MFDVLRFHPFLIVSGHIESIRHMHWGLVEWIETIWVWFVEDFVTEVPWSLWISIHIWRLDFFTHFFNHFVISGTVNDWVFKKILIKCLFNDSSIRTGTKFLSESNQQSQIQLGPHVSCFLRWSTDTSKQTILWSLESRDFFFWSWISAPLLQSLWWLRSVSSVSFLTETLIIVVHRSFYRFICLWLFFTFEWSRVWATALVPCLEYSAFVIWGSALATSTRGLTVLWLSYRFSEFFQHILKM